MAKSTIIKNLPVIQIIGKSDTDWILRISAHNEWTKDIFVSRATNETIFEDFIEDYITVSGDEIDREALSLSDIDKIITIMRKNGKSEKYIAKQIKKTLKQLQSE